MKLFCGSRFNAVLLALLITFAGSTFAQAVDRPRLIVVVSIDQGCQEYYERFRDNIATNEGIYALATEKYAIYDNCHHAHAFTITAPGHAGQMTGAHPQQHGIVGNDWYDRVSKKGRYCVGDSGHTTLGVQQGEGSFSPKNLMVPTVGDVQKIATEKKAKVFGVSLKDRASILMTGHLADAAFWYEEVEGVWVTSTYYRKDLPPYIRAFNESKFPDRYAEKEWTLLYDKSKYKQHVPDDFKAETSPDDIGKAFPHKLDKPGRKLNQQIRYTPFASEMTLTVAKEIVTNEQLGQDEVTDILCINLASNDYIGHAFGPHSMEVEDITYRTDKMIKELWDFVNTTVGKPGGVVLAMTADHGVCPLPEFLKLQGMNRTGRDPLGGEAKVKAALEPILRAQLGHPADSKTAILEKIEGNQLYLLRDHPALVGENFAKAQRICRDWLVKQTGIHTAVTRDDLISNRGGGEFHSAFMKTFHVGRSGDVLWAFEPYHFNGGSGTTHGSPWRYDTHVPMILVGDAIKHGRFSRRVCPPMLAPTVAQLIGIDAPGACVEEPLHEAIGLIP